MPTEKLPVHAVILAGRARYPLLAAQSHENSQTTAEHRWQRKRCCSKTVARLRPLVPAAGIWTVTNAEQESAVRKQLPQASRARVLVEPVGRNTAAAHRAGSVSHSTLRKRRCADGSASGGPLHRTDQQVSENCRRSIACRAPRLAAWWCWESPPTRPETGFRLYREHVGRRSAQNEIPVYCSTQIRGKSPALETAKEYLASGNYQWNAGMFFLAGVNDSRRVERNICRRRLMFCRNWLGISEPANMQTQTSQGVPQAGEHFRGLRHSGTRHLSGGQTASFL